MTLLIIKTSVCRITRHADNRIRRTLRVLAHVVCRPMHLCLNMVACEQAPSVQFIQICAWLVSASNFYDTPCYTVFAIILIIRCINICSQFENTHLIIIITPRTGGIIMTQESNNYVLQRPG